MNLDWTLRHAVVGMVVCVIGLPATVQADDCEPSATVSAAEALKMSLTTALEERGVCTEPPERCPRVGAQVVRKGDRLVVTLRDGTSEQITRDVSDVATAATLIESWSRAGEGLAPVLASMEFTPTRRSPTLTHEVKPSPRESLARFAVASDLGGASDGSTWSGIAASACWGVGPLCVGALMRGDIDLGVTGDSADYNTERGGLGLLGTAEYVMEFESSTLAPGVGLGGAWVKSQGEGREAGGAESNVQFDSFGPRFEVFLRVETPLSGKISSEITGVFGLAPFADTARVTEDGAQIAGVPRWQARLALGLMYGAL